MRTGRFMAHDKENRDNSEVEARFSSFLCFSMPSYKERKELKEHR